MGAIGEGEALILRVSRNCPWNRCLFCPAYKERRFSNRTAEEVEADIDGVKRITDLLEETSREMGFAGGMGWTALRKAAQNHPELYGDFPANVTQEQSRALRSLQHVANWLSHGAERVFLQDANALSMKRQSLSRVLRYLKDIFPTVDTITCYARSKTCTRRSLEDLRDLKDAGLTWCFVGIESGCDEVLGFMKKGVTMQEHIDAGSKIMASGLRMAAFVMPGLAGGDRELSRKHISDTVAVLNEVQPTEVRVRSLAAIEGSQLYAKWQAGEFAPATEDQLVDEIRMLVEGLTFDCTFETLQMTNPLLTVKGPLSQVKGPMLKMISDYQAMSPVPRAYLLLNRYVDGGYLDWVRSRGRLDARLRQLVDDARESIDKGDADGPAKADRAIFAIKSKGVP
jgi:histone acetyltransferase (RNA polymerase elongator complex component)